MRGIVRNGLIVVSIAFLIFSVFFIEEINRASALTTVEGTESRLTIWDDTDSLIKKSGESVYFYANFTNLTSSESINGSGVYCEIKFNYNGTWTSDANMTYNETTELFEYNTVFYYKGNHTFNITCFGSSQSYDDLESQDIFIISNTKPSIDCPTQIIECYEDTLCSYNLSQYVTEVDLNDNLTYDVVSGSAFEGLYYNQTTGMYYVNCTNDNCTGVYFTTFIVQDTDRGGDLAPKDYYIYAVNDPPEFTPAISSEIYVAQDESFYYDVNATDEENNIPFYFNITFINCTRVYSLNESCEILGINTTTGIINKTSFSNDEVGIYYINFTVTDSGNYPDNGLQGFLPNAISWEVVLFNVTNVNDPPNITTNLTEQIIWQNQSFYLEVNATDPENDSVTFSAMTLYRNLSLYPDSPVFQFNLTNLTMYDNVSVGIMNYTNVSNSQVGNFTLNITADDGNLNGVSWTLVNFTVYNINDAPVMDTIGNHTAIQDVNFLLQVNATDIDDFASYVPYSDSLNGTLFYNITFISGTAFFGIDNGTGLINFTGGLSEVGVYVLNVTVSDGGNLTDSEIINITVVANNPPNITTVIPEQTGTQNQTLYLEFNGTDPDNSTQNITFYTETYYRNMTLISVNKFPVTNIINSSWPSQPVTGIMNYTNASNSQVGNYTVRIILIDSWNVSDYEDVNFTVYNINDPPSMNSVPVTQTSYEDSEFFLDMNVTDIDYETPYGDNTTFNITFLNGSQFFAINNLTGIINFTVTNNSYEGSNYTINISAWDSQNIMTWQIINLTHYAVNDYPQFVNLNSSLESRVFEEFLYQVNATDEESGNSSLRYNLTFINGTQFFTINETTGLINFTVNESYLGTYLLNISVMDDGYNSTFQGILENRTNYTQIILDVKSQNVPPQITSVWNNMDQNWQNISLNENESITISMTIEDPNNDSMTCNWTVDGVINGDESEITPGLCTVGLVGVTGIYRPTFQDSGNHTIVFTIYDGNGTDSVTINANITNVNRPPQLVYLIGNQIWPMNTDNENINLSYHFIDPDNINSVTNDDNVMNYSINVTPTHITVSINQTSGRVTLTPDSDWYGNTTTQFVANDSEYIVNSSIIQLNVTYVETETVTITTNIGGTGSSTTTVTQTIIETEIASLTIEAEPMIEVTNNEEVKTPLKFINSGEVDLAEISIRAIDVDNTNEVELRLKSSRISSLLVGEEYDTEMTIITKNLTQQKYQVRITGDVYDPDFEQSATIYLRTVPINKTSIEEKIRFVKDYFEENPACIELMELIVSAERSLGRGDVIQAQNLTQLALDNCRDLIRYTANMTYSRPAFIEANRIPADVVIVSIIMTIAVLIIATAHYIHSARERKRERQEFVKKRSEERHKFHRPKM
ncbi:MAG: cadherin repeat domain-containing protein [Candidatus Aenigmarchaeota archaeon]|nr:cadherin repeat domain-containing protein [Candidatus Aenigmarchaeota archaeon]